MQATTDIDDAGLARLVEAFYARVRADSLLRDVFEDAVEDWPAHLERLAAFWSSVMLSSGRYKGTPVAAHLRHVDRITPAMFARWLDLWAEVTSVQMPSAATALQEKAARIARSLQLALSAGAATAPA